MISVADWEKEIIHEEFSESFQLLSKERNKIFEPEYVDQYG